MAPMMSGGLKTLARSFRRTIGAAGRPPFDSAAIACPCGGTLAPLVQSGRKMTLRWRHSTVSALACDRCCHVGFVPPSEADLDDYYRTEYGKGSED